MRQKVNSLFPGVINIHLFISFQYFYHHRNAVDIKHVLKEAYRLMESTPKYILPENTLEDFKPLTIGQYPVFNKYPKFIVDYQVF